MTGLAVLTFLVAAQGDERFPLEVGNRWTYHRDGREAMVVDAAETIDFGGVRTVALRVRDGCFLWPSSLHFATAESGRFRDHLFQEIRPASSMELLRFPLKEGLTWDGALGETYPAVHLRARVLSKEKIEVPAGAFEAWKIEYTMQGCTAGTLRDVQAWFAREAGFVRLRFWRESASRRKELPSPVVYDLARFEKKAAAPPRPALPPEKQAEARLRVLDLSDDRPEVREAATKALLDLGWGVEPVLEEALRTEGGAERVARVRDLLGRLPVLEAVVRPVRDRMKVGETPPVEYRLRNLSPRPVRVLPSLHQSDCKRDFPRYRIEVRKDDGPLLTKMSPRCGNVNSLLSMEFAEIAPEGEFDPFQTAFHEMLEWKPSEPGRYTFGLVYEIKVPGDLASWPVLRPLLAGTLSGRFESKPVAITVER